VNPGAKPATLFKYGQPLQAEDGSLILPDSWLAIIAWELRQMARERPLQILPETWEELAALEGPRQQALLERLAERLRGHLQGPGGKLLLSELWRLQRPTTEEEKSDDSELDDQ
jgi:hypothetical protein